MIIFFLDVEAKGEDDATPLHYAARFRPVPRMNGGTPRLTPQVTPSPSMENMIDVGLTLKRDDKKKDGGNGSLNKGAKDRLLGSLNKRRETIGNKLFSKDHLTVEKKNSLPKDMPIVPQGIETMIMYLLSRKANINAQDSYGSTPLHYAVNKGNPDAVKELLADPGIDIEVRKHYVYDLAVQRVSGTVTLDQQKRVISPGRLHSVDNPVGDSVVALTLY